MQGEEHEPVSQRAHERAPRPRRRTSRRVKVRRTTVAALATILLTVVMVFVLSGSSPGRGSNPNRLTVAERGSAGAPSIEAVLPPWTLGSALSREVVLPGVTDQVMVVGGLTDSQTSSSQIFSLDVRSGGERTLGTLAAGVHDAAGALIDQRCFVFGGGTTQPSPTVQDFVMPDPGKEGTPAGSTRAPSPPQQALQPSITAQLPQPRADLASVTIGGVTYLVGGYSGEGEQSGDAEVLATTDGRRFSPVASLPLAVRYAAVAALDDKLYVFGGEAAGGPDSGQVVNLIQLVNLGAGSAEVVGHLPNPLAGASAAVLGGRIYLAGGITQEGAQSPTDQIWAFDPSTDTMLEAGRLPVPTSYAGTTEVGGRAWLVGGEDNGVPVTTVQVLSQPAVAPRAARSR